MCIIIFLSFPRSTTFPPTNKKQFKTLTLVYMHPPLNKPHPLCEQVVKNIKLCHAENPYAKFWGACNDTKAAMDACFRKEKEMRRDEAGRAFSEPGGPDVAWMKEIEGNSRLRALVDKIELREK